MVCIGMCLVWLVILLVVLGSLVLLLGILGGVCCWLMVVFWDWLWLEMR